MMNKIVHLDTYFPTGELTVQPVVLWSRGKSFIEPITKHASVGVDYFKSIQPIPGHSIVYVLAVSAWERYGENRNGDGFPDQPYRPLDGGITEDQVLTKHYHSFETLGNVFMHHANSDPEKSVGKVMKAFWNDSMKRVELLLDVDNAKTPNIAERIKSGEFPAVSMGTRVPWDVCVLPETLVRTATGHKAIKDIEIGEEVRTHTGSLKRVTAHYTRETEEDLFTVTASGIAHPITATGQHPFLVLKKEDVRTCNGRVNGERLRHKFQKNAELICGRCKHPVELKSEWIPTENLRVGDYVVVPVDKCSTEDKVGESLATVLGFYLGNGFIIWGERHEIAYNTKTPRITYPSGVQFSMNLEQEDCIHRLCSALEVLDLPNGWKRYDNPDKTEAVIHASGPELAATLLKLGGVRSKTKTLHEEVFGWSACEKFCVIGGYLDTDGSVDAIKGQGRILSTNPGLLVDIQRLGLSLGINISVGNAGHPLSFDRITRIASYHAFIPAFDLLKFKEYSTKASYTEKQTPFGSPKSFFWGSYWCTPVTKIELNSEEKNIVHNLAVEKDESYLAEGVAVHNCSICLNHAPTRVQYCDHLRFRMRDVINGVKVAALNPNCKFFDISWVVRPADPNAYMLKKVADESYEIKLSGAAAGEYLDEMADRKLAAHKLAVIDKVVQGIPVDAKTENIDPMHLRNIQSIQPTAQNMSNTLPELPDSILRQLASSFSLPEIFTSTLAMGMPLCTREVVKITIYRQIPNAPNMDGVADAAVSARQPLLDLFQEHPQMLDCCEDSLDIDQRHLNPKVAELIGLGMEKRSGIYEYLKRKYVPSNYREESPYSTPLSVTDPASGQRYGTTRGAAIAAHDEIAKKNLRKVVGGAGVLAGSYGLISSGLRSKGLSKLNPLVAGTLGAVGLANLPSMGAHYMSDQGVPIPVLTELSKTSAEGGSLARSLALPLFGTLGTMALLGMDRRRRLSQGYIPGDPNESLSRRSIDALGSASSQYPLLFAGLGTMGLRAAGNLPSVKYLKQNIVKPLAQKGEMHRQNADVAIKEWAKRVDQNVQNWKNTKVSSDTVTLPEIDMDKIAESLGEILLNNTSL